MYLIMCGHLFNFFLKNSQFKIILVDNMRFIFFINKMVQFLDKIVHNINNYIVEPISSLFLWRNFKLRFMNTLIEWWVDDRLKRILDVLNFYSK